MQLKNIHALGGVFDLEVRRADKNNLKVIVKQNGREHVFSVKDGGTVLVRLN